MNEFDIINAYFRPLAENTPSSLSLTDDAALLSAKPDQELVITKDVSIAGIHFFENQSADLIARKCIRVNLSDIAAMGATPLVYLLALSLPIPANHNWLKLFSDGLNHDQLQYGIGLSGGDTVSTTGPISISITMLGQIGANKALKRSNALPGDDVWVSGDIGDATVALKIQKGAINLSNNEAKSNLLKRLTLPEPRIELGRSLIGLANSATDVSDGLAADLNNICRASGVGAIIEISQIPLSDWVARNIGKSKQINIIDIVSGGEDYELVFTAPPKNAKLIRNLSKKLDLNLIRIGTIVNSRSVRFIDSSGQDLPLNTRGFSHF